jgi:hypothetical protein
LIAPQERHDDAIDRPHDDDLRFALRVRDAQANELPARVHRARISALHASPGSGPRLEFTS